MICVVGYLHGQGSIKMSLSDKSTSGRYPHDILNVEDVKQFIKELKEELTDQLCICADCAGLEIYEKIIDDIAGEKLI